MTKTHVTFPETAQARKFKYNELKYTDLSQTFVIIIWIQSQENVSILGTSNLPYSISIRVSRFTELYPINRTWFHTLINKDLLLHWLKTFQVHFFMDIDRLTSVLGVADVKWLAS